MNKNINWVNFTQVKKEFRQQLLTLLEIRENHTRYKFIDNKKKNEATIKNTQILMILIVKWRVRVPVVGEKSGRRKNGFLAQSGGFQKFLVTGRSGTGIRSWKIPALGPGIGIALKKGAKAAMNMRENCNNWIL